MPYADPEVKKQKQREYYERNKKRIAERQKAYVAENKSKVMAYRKQWYQENKERMNRKSRERQVLRDYGLTLEEAEEMMQRDCAICGEGPSEGRRMNIDHNHDTGEVRDTLCNTCNRGIGFFFDCPDRLQAAIEYVRLHS